VRILMILIAALFLNFGVACDGGGGTCTVGDCDCAGEQECSFSCPEGGCRQNCEGNSICTATCELGGCFQACNDNASCMFTCAGGACVQSCSTTTGACDATCSGGGCTSD
jgi:hypothetical protein